MVREVRKEGNKKGFILAVGMSFVLIFIYNTLTPLMSDDLLFDRSLYQSIGDVFRLEYEKYMTWNGRSVLQLLMLIFQLLPKGVFNIFNSLSFVLTSLLIYENVQGRKKYDVLLFVLIQLLMYNFSVDFDQTVLWLGGACNYLWGTMIILGFLTLYRRLLAHSKRGEQVAPAGTALLVLIAFLAGWGNENTSGGGILIVTLFSVAYIAENRRIEKWMIFGWLSTVAGFAFLILAPGNRVRGDILKAEEAYRGIAALVSRGLKIFKAVDTYLLPYLMVICILGVYFYYERRRKAEFLDTAVFVLASLATAGVLIFTAEPMPRAYYGAGIYMMIGALNIVWKLSEKDGWLYAFRSGGILAGLLAFSFVYIEEGANLARLLREIRERDAYIREEVARGNRELVLPKLRPAFQSPYTYLYENDLSKEEDFWINKVYCIVYGLDEIEVLERGEWNEYIQQTQETVQ